MNLKEYLRASDGNGEAVRAVIVEERQIGDMLINVDSVLNWPHQGIATSGVVDTATGLLDPESVSVFYYTLNGSAIHIDQFAPGYTDVGHSQYELVLLKPTTPWADAVAEAVEEGGGSSSVIVSDTPPPDPAEGDLWVDTNQNAFYDVAKAVGNLLFPVGQSIITNSPANPATYYGFGTWERDLEGEALVGVDETQTEFDTVDKTGGAKTHTLTEGEMPSHNHTQNPHNHSYTGGYNTSRLGANGSYWSLQGEYNTGSTTATNNPTGGGQAHNNLQPYKTKYIWTRVA